jgi:cobalamin biosynthesis protein CobT
MLLIQQNVNINVKIFVPLKSSDDVDKQKTVEKKKTNDAVDSDISDSDDDQNMKDTRQVEPDEENDDDDEEQDDDDEDDDDDDVQIKQTIVKKELKVKYKPAWKWSPIKRPQKPAKVVSYSAFQVIFTFEMLIEYLCRQKLLNSAL